MEQGDGRFLLTLSGCPNWVFRCGCFLEKGFSGGDLVNLGNEWTGQLPPPGEVNREPGFSLLSGL